MSIIFLLAAIYLAIGLLMALLAVYGSKMSPSEDKQYHEDIEGIMWNGVPIGDEMVEKAAEEYVNTNPGFLRVVLTWPYIACAVIYICIQVYKKRKGGDQNG